MALWIDLKSAGKSYPEDHKYNKQLYKLEQAGAFKIVGGWWGAVTAVRRGRAPPTTAFQSKRQLLYTICNQLKINSIKFATGVYCFCCAAGAGGILNAPFVPIRAFVAN